MFFSSSFWVSASSHLTWVRMLMILVKLERTSLDVGRNHWQCQYFACQNGFQDIYFSYLTFCASTRNYPKTNFPETLGGAKTRYLFLPETQIAAKHHLELKGCGPSCPRTLMLRVYSLASVKSRRCCKAATVSANSRLQQMHLKVPGIASPFFW